MANGQDRVVPLVKKGAPAETREEERNRRRGRRYLRVQENKNPKSVSENLERAQRLLAAGANVMHSDAGMLILRPGFGCHAESEGAVLHTLVAPSAVLDEVEMREAGHHPVTPTPDVREYAEQMDRDQTVVGALDNATRKALIAAYFDEVDGLSIYGAPDLIEERGNLDVMQYVEGDVQIAGMFSKLGGAMKKLGHGMKRAAKSTGKESIKLAKAGVKEGKKVVKEVGVPLASSLAPMLTKVLSDPKFQAQLTQMMSQMAASGATVGMVPIRARHQ